MSAAAAAAAAALLMKDRDVGLSTNSCCRYDLRIDRVNGVGGGLVNELRLLLLLNLME